MLLLLAATIFTMFNTGFMLRLKDSVRHLYSAVKTTVIGASSHASVDDIKWVDTCRTRCQQSINYAHFHSIIKHGFFFCGNSFNSGKIFTLQKKIVRIMVGAQRYLNTKDFACSMSVYPLISELHYQ